MDISAQIRTRSAPAALLAACAAVFFSSLVLPARAVDLPPPLTLDFPIPANLATPAWLGHPQSPPNESNTLDLPITPPDPDAALLVTVYFQEKDITFLRVVWKSDQTAMTLADNFNENVGMPNARTLLIPPSTLGTGGTLIFNSVGTTFPVERIKFEWLESRQDLVSPKVSAMLVTTADGTSDGMTVGAETVNGQPAAPEAGAWDNDIVTVSLASEAVRIEQGVDFSIDLDKVPTTARLALKESGLPLNQHLVVWVNEKRAGTITPAVPGLPDAGFFTDTSSNTTYVGWRDGSFYVPVMLLKDGVNTLQFSPEDELPTASGTPAATASGPLALKTISLQLNYQPPPATATPDLPVLHLSGTAEPLPLDDGGASTTPSP